MKRVLAVAQVEPWPRIVRNPQRSRGTEPAEEYPLPVVAA